MNFGSACINFVHSAIIVTVLTPASGIGWL